jgi:hypothetical protein
MAGSALVLVRDPDGNFRTIERIRKGYLEIIPEICTRSPLWPPGSPGKCVKNIPEPEVAKQVVVTGGLVTGTVPRLEFHMSDLVVLGFLLGIGKDLVGLVDLLELFFRFPAALVQVRVIFTGKVPERLFQIIR